MEDCVRIEPFAEHNNAKVDILFAIKFGEHRCPYKIFGGDIRFVITTGELRLAISNGIIESDVEFEPEFDAYTDIAVQQETSETTTTQETQKASLGGKLDPGPSLSASYGAQKDHTNAAGSKERVSFDDKDIQILGNWHSTQPRWTFKPKRRQTHLRGNIKKKKFASVTANRQPTKIQYEFEVLSKDIHFTRLPLTNTTEHINKTLMKRTFLLKHLAGAPNIFSSGEIVA
jgi:hypothetical protein